MSYGYTTQAQRRPAPAAHPAPRPAKPNRPGVQRLHAHDYAFVHGRRQIRIGPVAFWICVGTLVIMAGWTLMTATYFTFKDDVLARVLAHQAAMQYAYEDRLADMRAQVDRVTSRQLLDQEQFEQKLDQIAKRQALLEQRTRAIASLADPTVTGSIKASARDAAGKPAPLGDDAAPRRGAQLNLRGLTNFVARIAGRKPAEGGLNATLAQLDESLERVEKRQSIALANVEEDASAKARRIHGVLAELGLAPGKALPEGVGGPFVPVKGPDTFERQMHRISLIRASVDRLNRRLVTVPIRQPLPELEESSGFGVRTDPFFRRPAMHTGLDFRGEIGDAVRATAAGTVTTAGWNGGYGKMVEIEHGNGLATRYGHLSEIDVREGQSIKVGQIIGRIGSTGRSTGPHLHYETRVDGDAVDPTKFLRAGSKLGLAQVP